MKHLILILAISLAPFASSWGQAKAPAVAKLPPDTALARKLGAGPHGMHPYVFCLLKRGPNKDTAKAARSKAFSGHFANISRLAEEHKLMVAGPFMDKSDWAGMFIFDVKTVEEAEALVKTDPAVAAGFLSYELHPLLTSATVQMIPEWHKKVSID